MSMLAFFPWLRLERDFQVGDYRLLRYQRETQPGGAEQPTLDAVLAPYLEGENRPIRRATLLTHTDRALLADLDQEDVADSFEVAELIAFSGLSAREYFLPGGMRYSNRETFGLVVQGFGDPAGGVGLRTRRRDGGTNTFVSPNQYRVRLPFSQYGAQDAPLDEGVLVALLGARDHEDWATFAESIYFFNQANTDSDLASEQSEIVSIASAFERLLDCRHGKEDELADRFVAAWQPASWLKSVDCTRIPPERQHHGIAENWIRDLFRYRQFHAHGRKHAKHKAVWPAHEHLLLGAYAFPLLLKQELARRGLYTLVDKDQADVDVFERLACADLFAPQPEDDVPDFAWNRVRGEFLFHRAFTRDWQKRFGDTTSDPRPE